MSRLTGTYIRLLMWWGAPQEGSQHVSCHTPQPQEASIILKRTAKCLKRHPTFMYQSSADTMEARRPNAQYLGAWPHQYEDTPQAPLTKGYEKQQVSVRAQAPISWKQAWQAIQRPIKTLRLPRWQVGCRNLGHRLVDVLLCGSCFLPTAPGLSQIVTPGGLEIPRGTSTTKTIRSQASMKQPVERTKLRNLIGEITPVTWKYSVLSVQTIIKLSCPS